MPLSHEAVKKLAVADHVLTQTYTLVQDPKLLITICQQLDEVGQSALQSGQQLTPDQRATIDTLHTISLKHRQSAVEFRRKQNYVICEDDYRFSVVSKEMVQRHLHVLRTI